MKGVVSDWCIAGQRTECGECRKEFFRLKALIKAAKSQNRRSPQIAMLEARLKDTRQHLPATSSRAMGRGWGMGWEGMGRGGLGGVGCGGVGWYDFVFVFFVRCWR